MRRMSQVAGGPGAVDGVEDVAGADEAPAAPAGDRGRSARRGRTGPDLVLAAIVLVGTVARAWGLGAQSYWYDEWLTARAADGTARNLYRYVTDQAGIPPTYFVVTWVWARLFGTGEVALRSISVLAGVGTIVVAYGAARALGQGRAVARVAALLIAVNPMLVWYSQEARPYSLVALLVACTVLFGARWLRDGRRLDLGCWALAATAAVAVHYYAVFLVLLEVIAGSRCGGDPGGRTWSPSFPPPWSPSLAPFGVEQFGRRDNHSWIVDFPLSARVTDAWHTLLVGPSVPSARLWLIAAVAVGIVVGLALATADASARRTVIVLVGLGLGAITLTWLAAIAGVDTFVGRYLIGSVVPLALAVAVAGVRGRPRAVGAAVVATLTVVSVVAIVGVQRNPDLQRHASGAVANAHQRGGEPTTGARAIVVDRHTTLAGPLTWYLDDHRVVGAGTEVAVTELDVVTATPTGHPCNLLVGLGCGLIFLGAPLERDLAGQLHEVERIEASHFVLVRYAADQPVTISPEDLTPLDGTWTPLLLVDDP